MSFEVLESRLALASVFDWDNLDSHKWHGEPFGGADNTVDWVSFDNRRVLKSQVASTNANYTVLRTDGFVGEDWQGALGLRADIYQSGGAQLVDVKLEVRGDEFNPPIETIYCENLVHDTWNTCIWPFNTSLPGYADVSHLSFVFDNLANTAPTFYIDDIELVTLAGTELWDDMDDGSREWFYFGNWFNWLPDPEFGLELVSHRGENPTTPGGSLYLQWDAAKGCCPDSNSAEIGTNRLDDLTDWSSFNRVRADVKITDPDTPLSLFFWDADTQTGFGTPTRTARAADTWQSVTWDVPWPPWFDNTDIDEVKFVVNGIDQHPTGTLYLDNIQLITDPFLPVLPGLEYRFASFEREDDITDFSSNWGALGVAWDDANSHKWFGESFGGDSNEVDWIVFQGRHTLRSRVTSSNSSYTVIRTDGFSAENWADKIGLRMDLFQSGGAAGVNAKLQVRGSDFDPPIEEISCTDLIQDAWKTCTWLFDRNLQGYENVAHLSLVFENLGQMQPTFYLDDVRLVTAAGVEPWDDMDDGSREWFYFGNWFDWLPNRDFGLEPVTHLGTNPTSLAGSLFLQWDHPNGVNPALDTAELGTTQLDDTSNWSAFSRILADVKTSNSDARISMFFWDAETSSGFSTAPQQASASNQWETLVWDIDWPQGFDTTDIDEWKFVVHDIDQIAAGTLYLDNIILVPNIAVDNTTGADGSRGSLKVQYSLPPESFTGTFLSLWGNSDCKENGPVDRCSAPESLDFTDIFGASTEDKDFEQIRFQVRGSGLTQNIHNVKVELKDVFDQFEKTAIRYFTVDDSNTEWQSIVLDADVSNDGFWSYNSDVPDRHQMKFLVFVVESFFNAPSGAFYIDNIEFVDTDDAPFDPSQNTDDAFLDLVSRRAFSYFLDWYEPTTGLFHDRSEFPDLMSIAATGFGITAMTIGAERGWIERQTAIDMITRTLQNLRDGQTAADTISDAIASRNGYKGFFYHFLDTKGIRKFHDQKGEGNELSSVDTALLLMGAITAKEYFSDAPQIAALVDEIYQRVDWEWFRNSETNQFYLGWKPELDDQEEGLFEFPAPGGGFFSSREDGSPATWDYSTDEVMLINLLAIGSPTHAVPPDVFYAWTRNIGTYAGHELVHSFNGSFFTYVFAHLWIDFQPLGKDHPPESGPVAVDWWENSWEATLANWQFVSNHADDVPCDGDQNFVTYSSGSFGLTASDGPDGNYHAYGALPTDPRANYDNPPEHDGTIAPYGAASAIVFERSLAIDALKHYFLNTESWNDRIGFGDAFNLEPPGCIEPGYNRGPWYNRAVFGIDNGPMLLAIENARSGFVWDVISRNREIGQALAEVFEAAGNELDFGDAPNSYGTTLASPFAEGGARHVSIGPRLGVVRDSESDASTPLDGSGDDSTDAADEDGVAMIATILAANTPTTASVAVTASLAAMLDAWMDFDRDGTFDEPYERLGGGGSIPLSSGVNVISFAIPFAASSGQTIARYRISSTGSLLPTGPASDGEVEDYVATLVNGRVEKGAIVDIHAPFPGQFDVTLDGDDVIVTNDGVELFRGPGESVSSLRVLGTGGSDTIRLDNLAPIFTGNIGGDAGAGIDTLRFIGSGQDLDLTQIPDADIQGIETIDIVGSGDNSLSLNVSEVINISSTTDELKVVSDPGDTVNVGIGWTLNGTQIENDFFYRVLRQQNVTLLLSGPRHYQNPIDRYDADGDGFSIAPTTDILPLINELNSPKIAGPAGELPDPATISFTFFFDINGDGFLTPTGDVLPQINEVNRRSSGEAEGPSPAGFDGPSVVAPLISHAPPAIPTARQLTDNSRLCATSSADESHFWHRATSDGTCQFSSVRDQVLALSDELDLFDEWYHVVSESSAALALVDALGLNVVQR